MFLGNVADMRQLILFLGKLLIIFYSWGPKPISNILSDSSSAKNIILVRSNFQLYLLVRISINHPGVQIIISGFCFKDQNYS